MKTPAKRLDCKELQTKILLIIKNDHQPASELLTVMPNELLSICLPVGSINQALPGPDSKQAAGSSSHTDKTVEDKGTGEKGKGGWEEVRGMGYNYWVEMEGD